MSELLAAAFLFSLFFFFAQGRRRICFKPPETACHESGANLPPRHAESKYLWVESSKPCATGLAVKPQTPFIVTPEFFSKSRVPLFPQPLSYLWPLKPQNGEETCDYFSVLLPEKADDWRRPGGDSPRRQRDLR